MAVTDDGHTPEPPSLWALVREDWVAHGRDWSRAGLHAVVLHRFGVARMAIQPRLLRAPFSVAYRALFRVVRNVYGIEIPESAKIGRRVVFEHQHGIVLHGCSVVGDDCILRQGVTLGLRSIDRKDEAPVLGRGVDVGAGAKILGRVTVGDGAAIGANAVVLEDVPPGTLAVGVPARIRARVDVRDGAEVGTPARGSDRPPPRRDRDGHSARTSS